jgi:hypothetical protein
MKLKEFVIGQLAAAKFLFDTFTKDFSDEDAKYQPCDGGIHLNWMLVHLAVSADSMISKIAGEPKKLSEALHTAYAGGSTCKPDDGMTRAEAQKLYDQWHERTVEFVKSFDEARYDEKAPQGFPELFPTAGSVIGLLATHPFWHFGQLTVNRRMLKKPKLLG